MRLFRSFSYLLIIGLLLRIILSATTYHSDILVYDFAGKLLLEGQIANFYDYLPNLPSDNPILKVYPANQFNYPRLVYFTLGFFSLLTTFLMPSDFHHTFLFEVSKTFANPLLFLHLLLLKLPYLLFDLGTAWLLTKLFKERKDKLLAFSLWIFNPVTLYATFMVGQHDIIPVFFSVLALVFIQRYSKTEKKWLFLAVIGLGLGGAFKIWPLFLLPLFVLVAGTWRERILAGLVGVATYLLPMVPFLGSSGFRSTALVANQTQKSLFAQIPISGGESLMLFVVVLLFFYLVFFYKKAKLEDLWQRCLLILLVFLIFTHYHPQWFLWITPFLLIELVVNRGRHLLVTLLLLGSLIGGILLFETGLNIGLFAPLNPALYDGKTIWQLVGINLDLNYFRSIFQSLFAAGAFYFLFYYFPKEQKES